MKVSTAAAIALTLGLSTTMATETGPITVTRVGSQWQTHPLGQTLIVTAGLGRVQKWGAIQEIRPGDVVWIPPGVKRIMGSDREACAGGCV